MAFHAFSYALGSHTMDIPDARSANEMLEHDSEAETLVGVNLIRRLLHTVFSRRSAFS
jgi:hypothetical protein